MQIIEPYIKRFQNFEFEGEFKKRDKKVLQELYDIINKSHFRRRQFYLESLSKIIEEFEELSFFNLGNEILKFRTTQRKLIQLTRQIIDENKKVLSSTNKCNTNG